MGDMYANAAIFNVGLRAQVFQGLTEEMGQFLKENFPNDVANELKRFSDPDKGQITQKMKEKKRQVEGAR